MVSIRSGYPLETIQINVLRALPETSMGNKYVVVVVDMYMKLPEIFALENQEAESVAQVVIDNSLSRFVFLADVPSDQGRSFESTLQSD